MVDGAAPLSSFELSLIADALQRAADEWGDNSCNDYLLDDTPEAAELVEAAERAEDMFEEDEGLNRFVRSGKKMIGTNDSIVASYLAKRVLEVL